MEQFMPEQHPTVPLTEEQKKEVQAKIEAEQARQEEENKKILEKFKQRGPSARVLGKEAEKEAEKGYAAGIENTL